MGWKNIKEHYRIGHQVHARPQGVCIGSPYVPDLITITPEGAVKPGVLGLGSNEDLQRYYREMTEDPAKLLELLNAPDTFETSIPVFTYEGGEIIEKQCEVPGWPNVTHDGEMMYENNFSTEKSKVVQWAKENARAGIRLIGDRIAELEKDIADRREYLAREKANLAKLEADYPEVSLP
jgi:hypothetical protein